MVDCGKVTPILWKHNPNGKGQFAIQKWARAANQCSLAILNMDRTAARGLAPFFGKFVITGPAGSSNRTLNQSTMSSISLSIVFQIFVALGLLNVWLIRRKNATAYRGGDAQNLKQEFAAYGLPDFMFYVVGGLKILAALALIAGIWLPAVVVPAAGVIVVLMLGAIAMHIKVGDPLMKSVPATLVLLMSATIVFVNM